MKAIFNGKHTHRSFLLTAALFATTLFAPLTNATAQTDIRVGESATPVNRSTGHEHYGHTFNLGLGPGYFGAYLMRSPYFTFNYEIDVLPDFTLAPFIGFSSYRSNPQTFGGRYYYYRGTIVPIGVKASYYFDDLINMPPRWDLYAAGSLGFTFINKRWEDGYTGVVGEIPGINPLFLDIHVGTEYHVSNHTGIFLDLSTGVSVVGVALHR
ncbi:hypothetical protein GCM10023093_30280 [Nemorincola caseinilytica]|uniref:Outer membrane protein beta-barrel domain-containing protein n=1 Tax=Nemorincola caseinilytica TaxID=2054315 RepID=A0ABP8NRN3_9BACT